MDQFEAAEAIIRIADKYVTCPCTMSGCPICADGGWYPNPDYVKAAIVLGLEVPRVVPGDPTYMGDTKLKPDRPGGSFTIYKDEISSGSHIVRIETRHALRVPKSLHND